MVERERAAKAGYEADAGNRQWLAKRACSDTDAEQAPSESEHDAPRQEKTQPMSLFSRDEEDTSWRTRKTPTIFEDSPEDVIMIDTESSESETLPLPRQLAHEQKDADKEVICLSSSEDDETWWWRTQELRHQETFQRQLVET